MGVVLWEIMTYGSMPYRGLTNQQVFDSVVNGQRLEQPPGCPDGVFDLMWDCWQLENRPPFTDIEKRLGNLGGLIEQHAQTPLLECSVGGRLGMFSQDLNAEKSINESTGLPINSQQQRASALATNERYVMLDANKRHNGTDNRASRHGGGGGDDDDDDDDDANGLYHLAAPNEGYCDMSSANRPEPTTTVARAQPSHTQALANMLMRQKRSIDSGRPSQQYTDAMINHADEDYIPDSYCDMANANKPVFPGSARSSQLPAMSPKDSVCVDSLHGKQQQGADGDRRGAMAQGTTAAAGYTAMAPAMANATPIFPGMPHSRHGKAAN